VKLKDAPCAARPAEAPVANPERERNKRSRRESRTLDESPKGKGDPGTGHAWLARTDAKAAAHGCMDVCLGESL